MEFGKHLGVAVLDVHAGAALGRPPTVAITTPSLVTCGVSTDLTATVGDPDGDFDTLRWYVDGILMSPSTTSMRFTGGHMLRAVAMDERGAATTAERSVACE